MHCVPAEPPAKPERVSFFWRADRTAGLAASLAGARRRCPSIHYVFLQDLISEYAEKLYRGYEILASAPFRITRNSNLYLEEEEARTLLEAIDSQVAQRRKGDAVRLEIEAGVHPEIINRLISIFDLDESLVFRGRVSSIFSGCFSSTMKPRGGS